jgi:hypothetical protein
LCCGSSSTKRGASTPSPPRSPRCAASTRAAGSSQTSRAGRSPLTTCRRGCSPRAHAALWRPTGRLRRHHRRACLPRPVAQAVAPAAMVRPWLVGRAAGAACSLQPAGCNLQPRAQPRAATPCTQADPLHPTRDPMHPGCNPLPPARLYSPTHPARRPMHHLGYPCAAPLVVGQERGARECAGRVRRRLSPRRGAHARHRRLGVPEGPRLRRLRRGALRPCTLHPATLCGSRLQPRVPTLQPRAHPRCSAACSRLQP